MNKNKKLGFTLAEVLIVIGIIGVVAALTLPNLNHATGDKETVTKVKKIYSTLNEAFDRAQAIYGPFDTWFNDLKDSEGVLDGSNYATASERFAKRVTEFMKVSKDCGFESGCFPSAPLLDVYGEEDNENDLENLKGRFYMLTLTDGTSLAFTTSSQTSDGAYPISIDIDGPNKGKNQDGADRFHFQCSADKGCVAFTYYYDAEVVEGPITDLYSLYYELWILQNENTDYLRCPDELNWDTKTSCK